jgi:hypothetical protein
MINYANTLPVQQVENLIKNLMTVSDLLISSNFEQHAAMEDLISNLDQSLDQRFELVC